MSAPPLRGPPVVARFEYRETDLVAAFRAMQGRARQVSAAMGVALVAMLAWSEHQRTGALRGLLQDPFLLVLLAIFAVVTYSVFVGGPRGLARRVLRKLSGEVAFTLDEEAVAIADPRWSGRFSWDWFDRALETRDVFVLVPEGQLAFVLPKRGLAAADVDRVRALLRARVSRYDGP